MHQAIMPPSTLPLAPDDLPQSWKKDPQDLQIHTTVPLVTRGETQNETSRRVLPLAMISEKSWIHPYTDCLATSAVTNGGAGVHIQSPEGQTTTAAIPAGKHCSNYTAEVKALSRPP